MKIAITGHRPNKLDNDYSLISPLTLSIAYQIQLIINKYKDQDLVLITGMALGIDTLFAQIAIENNIPFIAAIPCLNQDVMWRLEFRKQYHNIINHPLCTKVYVSNEKYTLDCMQNRNKWMVDNCDKLITVWNGSTGGTKNCVDYARKLSKAIEIIRINPNKL